MSPREVTVELPAGRYRAKVLCCGRTSKGANFAVLQVKNTMPPHLTFQMCWQEEADGGWVPSSLRIPPRVVEELNSYPSGRLAKISGRWWSAMDPARIPAVLDGRP